MKSTEKHQYYHTFCEKIKKGENFTFARYGDGEWKCILGSQGSNCDNHEYFTDLGTELAESVRSADYYLGMQSLAQKIMGSKINAWLDFEGLDKDWIDADVFHNASSDDGLRLFWDSIKDRRVMIVGNKTLRSLKHDKYVEVPELNCWNDTDRVLKEIAKNIRRNYVVLFCASMAANVWIDKCYNNWKYQHTFIDMGSVFDPYVGVISRKYHREIIAREGIKIQNNKRGI